VTLAGQLVLLTLLAACTGMYAGDAPVLEPDASRGRVPTDSLLADALEMVTLAQTPGSYRGACDGSAVAYLDFDHFVGMSDADQRIRIYKRGTAGDPLQALDYASGIGVAASAKVDFEELARVENRIYALSSHGRKDDGNKDPDRYRFVGIDITGQAPSFSFSVAGSRISLLTDMLATENWITRDDALLQRLRDASKLDKQQGDGIKPLAGGMNMEGLAHAPTATNPKRLMIGLRNPRTEAGRAIAVSLENPDEVVAGVAARLGEAHQLDFGGLGIQAMTWSPVLQQILVIAGTHDDSQNTFKLYRWDGTVGSTPTFVKELTAPPGMRAEGIVAFDSSKDIQIVFDADKANNCETAPPAQKSFTDQILRVE
jgi:hypothetical protein